MLLKTPGMYFVETSAYMNVPHSILIYRARARLAEGKIDEALALAREALAITPGHIDLVSGMVTELDRLGKKPAADEIFSTGWKAYQKVLAEFPDSPSARNALATLAANCRRELDRGLTYAQAAVKADPASVPYRETLAEVHFRRGERDKAIAVMTKLADGRPDQPPLQAASGSLPHRRTRQPQARPRGWVRRGCGQAAKPGSGVRWRNRLARRKSGRIPLPEACFVETIPMGGVFVGRVEALRGPTQRFVGPRRLDPTYDKTVSTEHRRHQKGRP